MQLGRVALRGLGKRGPTRLLPAIPKVSFGSVATAALRQRMAFGGLLQDFGRKKGKHSGAAKAAVEESDHDDEDEMGEEEEAEFIIERLDERMEKPVYTLTREYAKIRGAMPSSDMFDHIKVNVYGEEMQLNGIAQVVIKSPTLAVINPYDQTFVQQIANAVRDALSLNPQEDGKIVKVPLPKLTKERKDELVRHISDLAEHSRKKVRSMRHRAIDKTKKYDHVSEDDKHRWAKEIQALHDKHIKEIDSLLDKKKKEILV